MAMLKVTDLEVCYGVIRAIKGISFEVNKGEVVALIGANGAGKTTTLHTITGLIAPKAGKIELEGKDITRMPGHKIVSLGMAHVPEGRRVFADLTVLENLKLGACTEKRQERDRRDTEKGVRGGSRVWRSGKASWPVHCPAASSRCLPWEERSCLIRTSSSWMSRPWDFLPSM